MATTTTTKFYPVPGLAAILVRSEVIHKGMQGIGETAAAVARTLVPQDTGATHETIEGGAVIEDGKWTAKASANTPYAPYVEFGTSDTPAQPFMRPGADAAIGAGGGVVSEAAA